MENLKTFLKILVCLVQIQQSVQIEREMTFPVQAHTEECFFETALVGQVIELDYQVVDGGPDGSFAIDFSVTKPNQQPQIVEWDKGENTHQVNINIPSNYSMVTKYFKSREKTPQA